MKRFSIGYTDANEYNKQHYDRISVIMPAGCRKRLKEHVGTGYYRRWSVNQYILDLIEKDMKSKGCSLYSDKYRE